MFVCYVAVLRIGEKAAVRDPRLNVCWCVCVCVCVSERVPCVFV